MSFFDEDDEPGSRVRARRATPGRGGVAAPDRRTVLIRQGLLLLGFLVVLAFLIFIIRGCQKSAKETALKDYNQDVAAIVADSDRQVGKPFFDLMRNPDQGDLSTQINGFKSAAQTQYDQARRIDTPDEMTAAQRSFLITMEMRRDGLQSIADNVRTALSSDDEAADQAINRISGAMEMFLTSDVVYQARVLPFIDRSLQEADVASQRLQQTQFLPGVEWLQPATVADALGQQISGGGGTGAGREPAPGLHGTGIDSVQVGDQTLEAGTANRIAYGADTEFTVNFTNQGENDEVDLDVVLRIEGGGKTLRVTKTVASVAAGAAATAALALDDQPPLDTPVTITAQVKPVPGEEKKDNNTSEFDALFSQE